MFCFAPACELCQGVLKVNSSISGILLDPFWRKVPKYIRRAQMYQGSAESLEEGFTWLHPLPSPFCSRWAGLPQDSAPKFISCYTYGEHSTMCRGVESLHRTPETNVMWCANYTQTKEIIKEERKKESCGREPLDSQKGQNAPFSNHTLPCLLTGRTLLTSLSFHRTLPRLMSISIAHLVMLPSIVRNGQSCSKRFPHNC